MIAASLLRDELEAQGVTDVVGLPDNASAALFALLEAGSRMRLRTVTREGEAFALAAGLWLGGARPMVLIQNTGLLESGDALRGTVQRMRIPLVGLITYRGYSSMMRALGSVPDTLDPALLGRADVDSVALLTEPTLQAWGVPFQRLERAADLPRLRAAFAHSEERQSPVAVLLTCHTSAEAHADQG